MSEPAPSQIQQPPLLTENPGLPGSWRHLILALVALPIIVVSGILYAFPPDQFDFYPQCVIFSATGWQCPGCGGLRSMHALLHGNWAVSWTHNPTPILLAIITVIYGAATAIRHRAHHAWHRTLTHPLWILGFTLWTLVFALTRNFMSP